MARTTNHDLQLVIICGIFVGLATAISPDVVWRSMCIGQCENKVKDNPYRSTIRIYNTLTGEICRRNLFNRLYQLVIALLFCTIIFSIEAQ